MLLIADRDTLIRELSFYFAVSPKIFREMTDETLHRAWRQVERHEDWGLPTAEPLPPTS